MPQEEIVEVPSIYPISEEAINYLMGEDMYQGTLRWQGNKASTKFNYDMKKGKKICNIRSFSSHCIYPVLRLPKLGSFNHAKIWCNFRHNSLHIFSLLLIVFNFQELYKDFLFFSSLRIKVSAAIIGLSFGKKGALKEIPRPFASI